MSMPTKKRHPRLVQEDKEAARISASRCKGMRYHDLEPQVTSWKPAFGYGIAFRCSVCGTWRLDTYSPVTHDLLVRSYDAPPEYRELPKQSAAAWRGEYHDSLDPELIARDDDAPAHKKPGQRQQYPDLP